MQIWGPGNLLSDFALGNGKKRERLWGWDLAEAVG